MDILGYYNYWVFAVLLMIGFYAIMSRDNLIKKLLGLSILQSAVFLMYITMNKVTGGTAPIMQPDSPHQLYSNPLPQVLILTAIVVSVSTTALALSIVVRIKETYGTVEEREILKADDA